MNVDQKLINRMKRFQVIPGTDGKVTIRDGFYGKDIAVFEGPDALKRAGLMYREILGTDNPENAGVSS